ncbi:hypothetical protein FD724_36365 (plasmid) [Nostoc sp. C057]|uniref:hypothetical protein n=1 Tax=Nostoc sp. C057 TaxID=2576903 RepID=UPI0015C3E0D9|nr:hypothetical protein [Nostoc sp. C057]QLE53393.1 hypothetical protein FD724_36365 [Nostoc sp. C057]
MKKYEIHTGQTNWPCLVAIALSEAGAQPTGNGFSSDLEPLQATDLQQALSIVCPQAQVKLKN